MKLLRYQNRKIYSPITHKYVTAAEVLNLFKGDQTTRVIQKNTGEDVTSQIIIEALKKENISLDALYNLSQNVV